MKNGSEEQVLVGDAFENHVTFPLQQPGLDEEPGFGGVRFADLLLRVVGRSLDGWTLDAAGEE